MNSFRDNKIIDSDQVSVMKSLSFTISTLPAGGKDFHRLLFQNIGGLPKVN